MKNSQSDLEFAVKSRRYVSGASHEFQQARDLYSERRLHFPTEKRASLSQPLSANILTESNLVNKMSDTELQSLFGYSKEEALCVSASLSTLSLSNMKRQQKAHLHKSHSSSRHHSTTSSFARFSDSHSQNSISENSLMSSRISSHDLNKEIERYTSRKSHRSKDSRRRSSQRVNPYLLNRPGAPLARVLMSSPQSAQSLPQSCDRESMTYIQPVGEETQVLEEFPTNFTPFYDDDKENLNPSHSMPTRPLRILPKFSESHCPSPPRIVAKRPNNLINPSPIPAKVVPTGLSVKPEFNINFTDCFPTRMAPEGAEIDQSDFKEVIRPIKRSDYGIERNYNKIDSRPMLDEPLLKRPTPMSAFSQGEKSAFRPILAKTFSPIVTLSNLHLPMATAE